MLPRFAVLFIAVASIAPAQPWSIGYWSQFGSVVPIFAIDWAGLTHVVQGPAIVRANGTLDLTTYGFKANAIGLVAAARKNGVKALVGLEQEYWIGQTRSFDDAVEHNLPMLVQNIAKVVIDNGFDGVDIDWEPLNSNSAPAVVRLLSALRQALGNKIITVAASPVDHASWGEEASQYADRVNVMTYDLAGLWAPHFSWHNSALHAPTWAVWSVDLAVQRFLAAGVPRSKLGIGIPFYGCQWRGGGVSGPQEYWTSSPKLQQVPYNLIKGQITSYNYRIDPVGLVPYLVSNAGVDSFLSYEDERSITSKVRYVNQLGLGGWIIWNISMDYLPGQKIPHPLMQAVRAAQLQISQ